MKVLDSILACNEEAVVFKKHLAEIPDQSIRDFMENLDKKDLDTSWNEILVIAQDGKLLTRSKLKKKLQLTIGVIAASFLLFIGSLTFIHYHTNDSYKHLSSLAGGPQFTLADGTAYSLEDSRALDALKKKHSLNFSNKSMLLENGNSSGPIEGLNTIEVPITEDYKIVLPDGSKVWLNSESKMRFPFAFGDKREIFLDEGEAYFEVSHNGDKPFIVHTPRGKINVLGTSFNVNLYAIHKEVTSLITGKIAVNAISGETKVLLPGWESSVFSDQIRTAENFDQVSTLGWMSGVTYFKEASIYEIAKAMKRWYNVDLTIDDDSSFLDVKLRGKLFKEAPVQQFINDMNETKVVTFYWINTSLHCKVGEYAQY
ncbi:FecR family protein [Chitinophaga rhizosphaerae]|uniref:FecR family protein n=1 Tax=Chitinophaga rhizosphaerae TaxID=1864947 RepID=UPI0013E00742|nr:FecR family protein [Chitinophaga rhizosphaerae]